MTHLGGRIPSQLRILRSKGVDLPFMLLMRKTEEIVNERVSGDRAAT